MDDVFVGWNYDRKSILRISILFCDSFEVFSNNFHSNKMKIRIITLTRALSQPKIHH